MGGRIRFIALLIVVYIIAALKAQAQDPHTGCGKTFVSPLVDDIPTPHDSTPHSWPWLAAMCLQCESAA